ncbi:MAG: GAF domain-containing protein [Anaerolineae bacterium]|nr:GAF domain-containing protein [Anaerolineae bacterium]
MRRRVPFLTLRPSRGSLLRRVAGGMAAVALLTLVVMAVLLWQLTSIRSAIRDLRQEEAHLELALITDRQITELIAVIQEKIAERTPTFFVIQVGNAVETLRLRRAELNRELVTLTPDDPMRAYLGGMERNLQEVIQSAEGAIRQVEDNNWQMAEFYIRLLEQEHTVIQSQVDQLVELAAQRHLAAEEAVNQAMVRMITFAAPLVLLVLVIATAVVFFTLRNVTVGVEQLSQSAQRLAQGHFDERIALTRQDELGQLGEAFNAMAQELQQLYKGLEQQVQEQTRDLERRSVHLAAAAAVARQAAEIHDVNELLEQVVLLISQEFGFYHAGAFLLDESGEYAVLQAASSLGGQRMLARGHRLKVGQVGIVGYAAGSGEPRIALDVGRDAVFFDNPDLPNTRSEMALPLKVQRRVIGVLDVQSTEPAAFSQEDIDVLQTMADQIALALQDARLLEENQQALQEMESLYTQRVQQAWREYVSRAPKACRYPAQETSPITPSETVMVPPAADKRIVVQQGQQGQRLIAPISFRGQTFGTLVLQQDDEQEPWTAEEIALVEQVHPQIGLALENARLLEETERRADQERMTSEVSARVREPLDVEAVLETATQEIGEKLGLYQLTIRLGQSKPPEDRGETMPGSVKKLERPHIEE